MTKEKPTFSISLDIDFRTEDDLELEYLKVLTGKTDIICTRDLQDFHERKDYEGPGHQYTIKYEFQCSDPIESEFIGYIIGRIARLISEEEPITDFLISIYVMNNEKIEIG